MACGSLLSHGICGGFFKAARPGCGSSGVAPAGLGCKRGDAAEWLDGIKRLPVKSEPTTTGPVGNNSGKPSYSLGLQ